MATRTLSKRAVRLSANPLSLDDELDVVDVPDAPEEDPFAEDEGDDFGEEEQLFQSRKAVKGRRVSGPRTKLDNSSRGMYKALVTLAENQTLLAKSVAALVAKNDEEDEDSKEDKSLRKSRMRKGRVSKESDFASGDFDPYGDTDDEGDPLTNDPEESTRNEPGLQDMQGTTELTNARKSLRKSRIAKDDAASSFGEKDDDIPGNRDAGIDDKDQPAERYLIQGDAGDGPGPVSKAVVEKAVSQVLSDMGLLRKSVAPSVGNSTIQRGNSEPDVDELFKKAREMSFAELNSIRTASGLLPNAII